MEDPDLKSITRGPYSNEKLPGLISMMLLISISSRFVDLDTPGESRARSFKGVDITNQVCLEIGKP